MTVTPTSRQSGFTLVEVLVSLVIFGVGMLGIGKLMLFASRANDSAYQRDQATALAYSMFDPCAPIGAPPSLEDIPSPAWRAISIPAPVVPARELIAPARTSRSMSYRSGNGTWARLWGPRVTERSR
jgi:prepilin-type N-terminal cleavage/methylation domain-containing protein